VQLSGRRYVIVPEAVFEKLCAAARRQGGAGLGPGLAAAAGLADLDLDARALARRLAQRRRLTGLTQVELARRAAIRVETLNRIERGRTTPDFSTVRKLVEAMRLIERRR
jgi:DNA-binding XRE family transcriptional regulator